MHRLGRNQRSGTRDQRFLAHNFAVSECDLAESALSVITNTGDASHTRAVADDALEHVQSLSRFVPSLGRPAFCVNECAKKRLKHQIALVVALQSLQSWVTVSHQKGTETCLRKLGSSRQSRPSHLLAAWKQTCSAALPVLRLALPLPKFWVQTHLLRVLLAHPLACFATTQASAVKHAKPSSAPRGRGSFSKRRRGLAPAAFLRFKEPSHV